jgi:hypothetical protein
MNSHEGRKEKQTSHKHNPLKHMLHMILCCGLPIVIMALLPIITTFSPGAASKIGKIAPYLCPLMMIAMIPMMMRHNKKGSCCDNTNENLDNNKSLELNKPIEK